MAHTLQRRINRFLNSDSSSSPEKYNEKFIRNADYDKLEQCYNVCKYYPLLVHNDVPTPYLKQLLADKPIYAKANRHVAKEIRRQKKQYEEQQQKSQIAHRWEMERAQYEAQQRANQKHTSFSYNDPSPLDSRQPTMVDHSAGIGSRLRRGSLAAKFLSVVKGRDKDVSDIDECVENTTHPLRPSRSYDQTKSAMTFSRKNFRPLHKFHSNRRSPPSPRSRHNSIAIGTYQFFHIYSERTILLSALCYLGTLNFELSNSFKTIRHTRAGKRSRRGVFIRLHRR